MTIPQHALEAAARALGDSLEEVHISQLRLGAAAAIEAYEAALWRPIEEAPKDFVTVVDIWRGDERIENCIWGKPTYGNENCWVQINASYDCDGPVDEEVYGATHFRPLPNPPEEPGKSAFEEVRREKSEGR